MKSQLVFEFIIAGLIFFAIVMYSINYLNVSMSDFKSKFFQNNLQSKTVRISEILLSGNSNLSISDGLNFNISKIQAFNITYCPPPGNYIKLIDDLYLYETTDFGIFPDNIKIGLATETQVLLDCGPRIVPNIAKADVERIGLFQGEIAKLRVTIW